MYMGNIYQNSYLTDENTALTWWEELQMYFCINCIWNDTSLHDPGDCGKYAPSRGVEWVLAAIGNPSTTISINAWKPKNTPSHTWRVDVVWRKDNHTNANVLTTMVLKVEEVLVRLGAQKYNP